MKLSFWDKLVKNVTGSFPKKTQAIVDAESLRELRAFAAKVQAEAEAAKFSAGPGKIASADDIPKKKKPVRKAEFKAEARDGDGDGLVQDGTAFERPATSKKKATPRKKKPSN